VRAMERTMQSLNVCPFTVTITKEILVSMKTSLPRTHRSGSLVVCLTTADHQSPAEIPPCHTNTAHAAEHYEHSSAIQASSMSTVKLFSHVSVVHGCILHAFDLRPNPAVRNDGAATLDDRHGILYCSGPSASSHVLVLQSLRGF
jgi:hypothetical protein